MTTKTNTTNIAIPRWKVASHPTAVVPGPPLAVRDSDDPEGDITHIPMGDMAVLPRENILEPLTPHESSTCIEMILPPKAHGYHIRPVLINEVT